MEKKRLKLTPKVTKPKSKIQKKVLFNDSSDSECVDHISLHDKSDYEDFEQLIKSRNLEIKEQTDYERGLSEDLVLYVSNFVHVELQRKK